MLTVLFTTTNNETGAIVLADAGTLNIERHAHVAGPYLNAFLLYDAVFYKIPHEKDAEVNDTLYTAKKYSLCLYLYFKNLKQRTLDLPLWKRVSNSMMTEGMTDACRELIVSFPPTAYHDNML